MTVIEFTLLLDTARRARDRWRSLRRSLSPLRAWRLVPLLSRPGWTREELDALDDEESLEQLLGSLPELFRERRCL
jgi:hypothetical protein